MEMFLLYGVYIAMGAVFVVLAFGVVNLIRTDGQARSRSNKLMRMRVLIQFVALLLLVALGAVAGACRSHPRNNSNRDAERAMRRVRSAHVVRGRINFSDQLSQT